jgi:thioredoxin 1
MRTWLGVTFALLMVMGCQNGRTESGGEKEKVGAIVKESTVSVQDKAPVQADPVGQKSEAKKRGAKVTFVELGSVNCIPCKMMKSVMEAIEKEYGDQVQVIFHDVWTDAGKEYGIKYKIDGIPTQVFLDQDGKEYYRHMGFFSKDEVVDVLKKGGVR